MASDVDDGIVAGPVLGVGKRRRRSSATNGLLVGRWVILPEADGTTKASEEDGIITRSTTRAEARSLMVRY